MPSDEKIPVVEELLPGEDPISEARAPITCDLDASILCETIDGGACAFSQVPAQDMMCQDSPTKLIWLYEGGNCSNSSSGSAFICEDTVEGWQSNATSVYIEIHGEESDELYYQGLMNHTQTGTLNNIIELARAFSVPMENIFVHIKTDDVNHELLQMLVIPNACHPQEGLVIGKTYGALQFGGYQTASKLAQGFEHLEWTFIAQSDTGLDLSVKTATAVVDGEMQTFKPGVTLSQGEEVAFTSYKTIALHESRTFSGAVTFVAEGLDGMECAAAAASYIFV